MAGAGDHIINILIRNEKSRWEKWITEDLRGKDIDRSSEIPQSSTHNKNTKPKIGRVLHILDNDPKYEKYYKPSEMPIGPIHRHNGYAGEHYKYRLARKFIQENEIVEVNACDKIFDIIKDLRECYDREVTMSEEDDSLVWILFMDGCSTLGFISSLANYDQGRLPINNNKISLIIRDLFMLENQLPFRVLELLIDLSNNKDKLKNLMLTFISFYSCVPISDKEVLPYFDEQEEKEKPAHLLDLLRLAVIVHSQKSVHQKLHFDIPNYFVSSKLASVQDLKWSGFQFRRSKDYSLKGITFSSSLWLAGYLDIPPITVDDTAKTMLINLVAYDMRGDTDCEVSSYIWFLNSLINDAEDVKELRSARILSNKIGTDQEVVRFFSEIPTDLVPNIQIDVEVLRKLEEHNNNGRRDRWMAEVWYKYFDSPWTIMALIAGGLALFLTTVQTWFTVFPNK